MIPLLHDLPAPRSAWLLVGDDASLHSEADLKRSLKDLREGYCETWTASQRVEAGDLLFIYYISPHKEIREVTRALDRPYREHESNVLSLGPVSQHQWLVKIAPPIQIEAISYAELSAPLGEKPLLKGRSGKYLPPRAANELVRRAKVTFTPDKGLPPLILQRVIGREDLPRKRPMSLSVWSSIPSALLRFEREVEEYIVEPLFRLCNIDGDFVVRRQRPVAKGFSDYVIESDGVPRCVVEVKQRIQSADSAKSWSESEDYRQLQKYCGVTGCHGALIDCDQIILFNKNREFVTRFERRNLKPSQLKRICAHLRGLNSKVGN
jgi:hypothetical protein